MNYFFKYIFIADYSQSTLEIFRPTKMFFFLILAILLLKIATYQKLYSQPKKNSNIIFFARSIMKNLLCTSFVLSLLVSKVSEGKVVKRLINNIQTANGSDADLPNFFPWSTPKVSYLKYL